MSSSVLTKLACSGFVIALLWYFFLDHVGYIVKTVRSSCAGNEAPFWTSAWCRGNSCHFRNLCYRNAENEFLFVLDPDRSVLSGVDIIGEDAGDAHGLPAWLSSVPEVNGHRFSYTELPPAALRSLVVQFLSKKTLLVKRFKPDNLMHALHDDILPIFSTLQELGVGGADRLVFVDDPFIMPYFRLYTDSLNIPVLLSESFNEGVIYCFEEAFVGLNMETKWYQYGFGVGQFQGPLRVNRAGRITINNFVTRITATWSLGHQFREQESDERQRHAVVIARRDNRIILNLPQMVDAIVQITGLKVHVVSEMEEDDLFSAIQLVASAKILVGMHGASLVLALFLPPTAGLLELFPYAVPAEDYTPYRTLAEVLGLRYAAWENRLAPNSITHPDYPPALGGLQQLKDEGERSRIISSQRVHRWPCCDHPEWLFRIYQDTWVDIPSFRSTLFSLLQQEPPKTLTKPFHRPGPVLRLSCTKGTNATYHVAWEPPWNTQFLQGIPQYEVWIHRNDSPVKAAVTFQPYLDIAANDSMEIEAAINCWVRCIIQKEEGAMKWIACGQK